MYPNQPISLIYILMHFNDFSWWRCTPHRWDCSTISNWTEKNKLHSPGQEFIWISCHTNMFLLVAAPRSPLSMTLQQQCRKVHSAVWAPSLPEKALKCEVNVKLNSEGTHNVLKSSGWNYVWGQDDRVVKPIMTGSHYYYYSVYTDTGKMWVCIRNRWTWRQGECWLAKAGEWEIEYRQRTDNRHERVTMWLTTYKHKVFYNTWSF